MMHKCRWCEGSGQLLVAECGWRPDDIREFSVECADCVGEGEVDQEAFTEQHELREKEGREWVEEKSLRQHHQQIADWRYDG